MSKLADIFKSYLDQNTLFSNDDHPGNAYNKEYPHLSRLAMDSHYDHKDNANSFGLLQASRVERDFKKYPNGKEIFGEIQKIKSEPKSTMMSAADKIHKLFHAVRSHPMSGKKLDESFNVDQYKPKPKAEHKPFSRMGREPIDVGEDYFKNNFIKSLGKNDNDDMVASIAVMTNGQILMGKRNDGGLWTLPGGHAKKGENPVEAAVRELREETGIKADERDLVYLGHERVTPREGGKIMVHSFLLNDKVKTDSKNDPDHEVQKWEWINVAHNLPKNILDNLHAKKNVTLQMLDLQPFPDEIGKSFELFKAFDWATSGKADWINPEGKSHLVRESFEKNNAGKTHWDWANKHLGIKKFPADDSIDTLVHQGWIRHNATSNGIKSSHHYEVHPDHLRKVENHLLDNLHNLGDFTVHVRGDKSYGPIKYDSFKENGLDLSKTLEKHGRRVNAMEEAGQGSMFKSHMAWVRKLANELTVKKYESPRIFDLIK